MLTRRRLISYCVCNPALYDVMGYNGAWTIKKGKLSIRIYENGDILRHDIPLELCKKMSVKEAGKYLNIEENKNA